MTDGALALAPDSQREALLAKIKGLANVDTVLFLDYETFYKTRANNGSKSFSLKGKTYVDYIFDERFHTTGLGFAEDNNEWEYIHTPDDMQEFADDINKRRASGERIALVAHNTQFDGSILSWLYGTTFDFYFCTQLMAVQDNPTQSKSLANVAIRLWPNDPSMRKGVELASFDGVLYCEFTADDHKNMETYCVQDNFLMREIFFKFLGDGLPVGEIPAMHITLRACIEPQFRIKRSLLQEVQADEEHKKSTAVAEAIAYCHSKHVIEVSPATFSSNPKYKALLERFCVVVPLKMNDKFQMTPALGKGDPAYIKCQIANPHLEPIFKARAEVKSTIALTRAKKMLAVADMFAANCPTMAEMPMFLNYYGALNTGRWSGGQKLNQQNLPRGGKHRLSLRAREGYKIAVNDLSNIELRVNLWFCEQEDLLAQYEIDMNFDMYSDLATDIFGFAVNKKDHKNERQMGKAGSLGLGYAMSWFGFQQYLASGPLGMEPMFVPDEFAKGVKNAYDMKHYMIKNMWKEIEHYVLPVLEIGGNYRFGRNKSCMAMEGKIHLPSGRVLHYPNTRSEMKETDWGMRRQFTCDGARFDRFGVALRRNLHKGLIIENIIQAISRDVLNWQINNIERDFIVNDFGWVIGSVHDEVLTMSVDETVKQAFDNMQYNMRQVPEWGAGMPLASEGGYADDYSK